MKTNEYDVVVIGGGAAGLTAAKTAAGLGKRVLLIEKRDVLGGECTWTGCVPSKTLIKSARVAHRVKNADKYGIITDCHFDTKNVMPYVRSVVREVYTTHTPNKLESLGVEILFGSPTFVDAHTLHVNDCAIISEKIIIATGSQPFIPPIEGLDQVPYLTNHNLFNMEKLPKSMIILGGGAIGVEMGSAFARLGVAVTMIEMNKRILMKEDAQLVDQLADTMRADGVVIRTGLRAAKVIQHNGQVQLVCIDTNDEQQVIAAEKLLVAVGRTPNVSGLNLAAVGIKVENKGILVDTQLRTTVKNVYACGDVVGPYQFSHMAWYQAVIAARNACIPFFKKHVDYRNAIWVTFSSPELATLGMTERQARAKYGDKITVYERSYGEIDRGITDRMLKGVVKVVCDKRGYIIGATMLGDRAGEVIHELQIAKMKNIKLYELHDVIHAYPTYAELVWHIAKKAYVIRLQKKWYVRLAKWLFFKKK